MLPVLVAPASGRALDCAAEGRAPDVRCSPLVTVLAEPTSGENPSGPGDTLWRLWVDQDRIWIQHAAAADLEFSAARAVNQEPEPVSTGAENRPRLTVAGNKLHVVWSRPGEARFTADVRVARSVDGGRTFNTPRTVNRDGLNIGHSFADVLTGPDGRPVLLWLDGRERHAAEADGREFTGSSLFWTQIDDAGELAAGRSAAAGTCECCRLATARLPDGRPVVMWRHVFDGGERDHALGVFDGSGIEWKRASFEHWRIDGCPHHGPTLAADEKAGIHAAWFSGAAHARGLFYRRFDADWIVDEGATSGSKESALPVGDPDRLPAHPAIAVAGPDVALAWREFDGDQHLVRAQRSNDLGKNWGAPVTVARGGGEVDHPALVVLDGRIWLSWHLPGQQHRLMPLADGA